MTDRQATSRARRAVRSLPMMGAWLIMAASVAQAGTLRGVVTIKTAAGTLPKGPAAAQDVVVWLEGPARAAVPAHAVISQRNIQFSTPLLVIRAGQTVEMPNEDHVAHNVFSLSPARRFNLGIYPRGMTKDVTFLQPGIVQVLCSLHRRMKATIVVVPNEHHTVTSNKQPYRIAGVPGGRHLVRAWADGMRSLEQVVAVPERGEIVLNLLLPGAAN